MGLLLLIAAGIVFWAWKDGRLATLRYADVAAVAAALIGLRLLSHGGPVVGVAALAGAGAWAWYRMKRTPSAAAMTETEALMLLELPVGADGEAIRTAHRRLIARVHPDHGGSIELARRVNVARDILLAASKP